MRTRLILQTAELSPRRRALHYLPKVVFTSSRQSIPPLKGLVSRELDNRAPLVEVILAEHSSLQQLERYPPEGLASNSLELTAKHI
jgi:hypothetical protein